MLHGYCVRFAADPRPEPMPTGVGGGKVSVCAESELELWVSEVSGEKPSAVALREHERVVRSALRCATPLPLRFGSHFADDSAVRAALADRADEFRQALLRLAGHAEVGLRVTWKQPASPSFQREDPTDLPPGRAYLQRRKGEIDSVTASRKRAEEILTEVDEWLSEVAEESRVSPVVDREKLGDVAHLVRTGSLHLYRERLACVSANWPDLRITATGPWPPYSFVDQ